MKSTQEKTMEWRNKIRSVIAPLLIEELRRSGTMDKVAHATLLSNMTDELYALLASSQDSFRRKVEGLIGEDDKFNYQDIEELSEIKGRNQLRAEQRAKLKNIK